MISQRLIDEIRALQVKLGATTSIPSHKVDLESYLKLRQIEALEKIEIHLGKIAAASEKIK